MSNDSKLLLGLVVGVAAGAVAGLLLAPTSGKESRSKLKETSRNFKEDVEDKLKSLSDKIDRESLNDLKETFKGSKGKLKDEYDTIAKKVKDLEQEIEAKIKSIKNKTSNQNPENSEV